MPVTRMPVTRRNFLRAGATSGVAAGALAATPAWLPALGGPAREPAREAPPIHDPAVRDLALRAVEAARAAGATYADVRLTHTRSRPFDGGAIPQPRGQSAWLDTGVRALVDGSWGFAAGTVWTPDELARLGREAVHQAKVNALGPQRRVELGRIPVVQDGHWTMPVERDPFEVPDGEILDLLMSLDVYAAKKTRGGAGVPNVVFHRQDKAFASSEGSYCTQRLYRTSGAIQASLTIDNVNYTLGSPILAGASRGWEYVREAPLRAEVDRLLAEIEEDHALPIKPVEVGRYDVVFDAHSLARLLNGTLGAATELDRALGYEANAGGTSYLNDPAGMLGTYQAGAPILTVTAERSAPGALATVKWDDEGVEPDAFPLVTDGVLVDFQTHREATGWLAGPGRRSHGCAAAPRAFDAPLIHSPNLTLAPGKDALDFEGLVAGLTTGLAVKQLGVGMDFQCLNGYGSGGRMYEVKAGKRVARIDGGALLVRAPEFWKGLQALGGAASQRPFAATRAKGEPTRSTSHTVNAVPGVVKSVTLIRAGAHA